MCHILCAFLGLSGTPSRNHAVPAGAQHRMSFAFVCVLCILRGLLEGTRSGQCSRVFVVVRVVESRSGGFHRADRSD